MTMLCEGSGVRKEGDGSHDRNGLRHRNQLTELQSHMLLLSTGNGDIQGRGDKSWFLCPQLVFSRINVIKNEVALLISLSFANCSPAAEFSSFRCAPATGTPRGSRILPETSAHICVGGKA